jgi:S1-C subfamily serine protease
MCYSVRRNGSDSVYWQNHLRVVVVAISLALGGTLALGARAVARSTVEIVAKAKPCVVSIKLFSASSDRGSSGIGFFIDNDKILTDAHVVKDGDSILVQDLDGNNIEVESYPLYFNDSREVDLAVLQVKDPGYHAYLSFRADLPLEGETVTVVGNPQGLTATVSTGIVSAVRNRGNLLQFTAPVSNGSSGSPLLDEQGRVIGIATGIRVASGEEIAENLNFANGVPLIKWAIASQINSPSRSTNEWFVENPDADKTLMSPPSKPVVPTREQSNVWPDGRVIAHLAHSIRTCVVPHTQGLTAPQIVKTAQARGS